MRSGYDETEVVVEEDLVSFDDRLVRPLITAEAAGANELAGLQIEDVAVHRTRDALLFDPPLGERGARVIAGVLDGPDTALDPGDADVERRMRDANEAFGFDV